MINLFTIYPLFQVNKYLMFLPIFYSFFSKLQSDLLQINNQKIYQMTNFDENINDNFIPEFPEEFAYSLSEEALSEQNYQSTENEVNPNEALYYEQAKIVVNQSANTAFKGKNNFRNANKNTNQLKIKDKSLIGSRVMPHSIVAEKSVLSAMMLSKNAQSRAVEILQPECFYSTAHKKIFEAILALYEKGYDPDLLLLSQELIKRGDFEAVGGNTFIAELSTFMITDVFIEQHSLIVQEKFLKRSMIEIAGQMLVNGYEDTSDALEEIDRAEAEIFRLAEQRFKKSYQSMNTLVNETARLIFSIASREEGAVVGVPSGIMDLDKMLGGFQNSDLIIVAARPSMGKTAFALSITRNAALVYKRAVAVFSLEMASSQLVTRLISGEAKINQHKIRTGQINAEDNQKIISTIETMRNLPIYIDDTPGLSVMELRAKCRRLKSEHKIEMVVVDYLQLLQSPRAESREREISIISSTLKQIAKELEIPVIALAQLNRSVEQRTEKRPMLSDLRESGSIEQDADVVMFVNRPEVYGKEKYEDGYDTKGTGEIIIGKQRNGPIGTVRCAFLNEYARFENLQIGFEEMPGDRNNFNRQNDESHF